MVPAFLGSFGQFIYNVLRGRSVRISHPQIDDINSLLSPFMGQLFEFAKHVGR
jgi:hypothetical protein